jgi:hypothetical protein
LLRPPPLPPLLAAVIVCRRLLPVMHTPAEGTVARSQPAQVPACLLISLPRRCPCRPRCWPTRWCACPRGWARRSLRRWSCTILLAGSQRCAHCAALRRTMPHPWPLDFSSLPPLLPPAPLICPPTPHYAACVQGKVVFVAPTKPLVAQQVEACHSFMGMSKAGFCELTGASSRQSAAACLLCVACVDCLCSEPCGQPAG